jgi:ABC-type phosphate transport system auxiliary subunit
VEDLRAVGSRVSMLAIIGLVLLLASLGLNAWFLIQLQHILR